jgi:hypothetical protein
MIFVLMSCFLYFTYFRNKRIHGKRCATKIQAWYRGCKRRRLHADIRYTRQIYVRLRSVTLMQAVARRYMATNVVKRMRALYRRCAIQIQRIYRGFWCRKQLKIDWAARRLTKFMKTLHFFRFRDAVIMIMQLRRLFKKRTQLTILIQRVFRGYSARVYAHHKRFWFILSKVSAYRIQRRYRAHLELKRAVPWLPPGEAWMLRQCARKICTLLYKLHQDRAQRRLLRAAMQRCAVPIQRVVRGFLARTGAKKMANMRQAIRNWAQPRVATEFMEDFLSSRVFKDDESYRESPSKVKKEAIFIRQFLPEDHQTRFEIPYKIFEPAMIAWYKSVNMVLLKSEKDSVVRKFRNPMNGNMQIKPLDEFIGCHPLPCRKHGRFICGDCVFRKNCQIANCHCPLFKSSTADGHGICLTCDHPGSLHSLCPNQVRGNHRSNNATNMLRIVTAVREPDMSFPTGVEGIAAEGIVVPKLTADDKREIRTKEIALEKKEADHRYRTTRHSLTKSLALCAVRVDL